MKLVIQPEKGGSVQVCAVRASVAHDEQAAPAAALKSSWTPA